MGNNRNTKIGGERINRDKPYYEICNGRLNTLWVSRGLFPHNLGHNALRIVQWPSKWQNFQQVHRGLPLIEGSITVGTDPARSSVTKRQLIYCNTNFINFLLFISTNCIQYYKGHSEKRQFQHQKILQLLNNKLFLEREQFQHQKILPALIKRQRVKSKPVEHCVTECHSIRYPQV